MEALFEKVQRRLQGLAALEHMECWLQDVDLTRDEQGNPVLLCPNRFALHWLEKKHSELLTHVFREEIGRDVDLTFQLNQGPTVSPEPAIQAGPPAPIPESPSETKPEISIPPGPLQAIERDSKAEGSSPPEPFPRWNPHFCFATFVTGSSNGFACSAALEVSRQFRRQYNPFLIHGSTGLGKTHLGQAIGHSLYEKDPSLRIICCTAEDFLTEMIHHIKNRTILSFKEKYRQQCDVFILDDIQFLAGKNALQSELCYTLDILINQGKQVILLGNLPNRHDNGLDENLNSRIFSGLTVSMEKPDFETRLAILTQYAETFNMKIPNDIMTTLAKRLCSHVRDLEGSLKRLTAMHSFSQYPLEPETVEMLFNDMPGQRLKPVGLTTIQAHVARFFKLEPHQLASRSRQKKILYPRQIAMYLSRKLTDASLETIGALYNRDHTSVLYAVKSLKKKITLNQRTHREIRFIEESLLDET